MTIRDYVGKGLEIIASVGRCARTVALAATVGVGSLMSGGDANAIDTLKIYNSTNSVLGGQVNLMHKIGASDDYVYGSPDNDRLKDFNILPNGSFDLYSGIPPNYQLRNDSRPPENLTPFNLGLVYKGNVNPGTSLENHLTLEFGTDSFGTLPLSLRETNASGVPNGKSWDVRDVIANHGGIINLPNLAAGIYTTDTPYKNLSLDFNPIVHTLQIDFYKNTGTAGTPVWVRADQNTPGGVGPLKITYTNDPAVKEARDPKGTANPTGDPFDKWVKQTPDGTTGWPHVFNNTTLGEFGAYTRQAAFGFDGTTSTNDRMQEEGRPLDSTSNILIETYRNSSITTPIYSENDSAGKWKMTFTTSTADFDFFKDFRIIQNEPYDFWADPRYDSRKENPATIDPEYKVLSTPETHQEPPYVTLENLLNSEAGLLYTTQGCLMGDGSTEIDSLVGPIGAFDIFPSGGTPYNYFVTGNETFFIEGEGNYSIWHTTTPEPSTLSLLAMAGIAGAGAYSWRKRKSAERKEE